MGSEIESAARRIEAEFRGIAAGGKPKAEGGDSSFGKVLESMLDETNGAQVGADQALQKLVVGETDDLNGVMLAMAKADVSFRMMLEVRNKLVDAYQEVMRMQV